MSVVLDASALLAYLNQEAGAEAVAKQMIGGGFISAVNLAEVYSKVAEWGQDVRLLEQALVHQGLLGGVLEVVPFGPEDVLRVAALRPLTKTQGLSLGDRVCLALAQRLGLPAITTDSAWSNLDAGVEVRVVR
ncbi:type II toxin-antitoxin system VapC family toxin [Meiothermus sp. CFH 77666]|uniref:type II toxin-antitoxin system VapC family toxin n=1 Tax=Meiothermus sp. CFH 77666 TaxID=2817942 RepID=UPI001AA02233|nr:type II toxin-antitoxin system VapC family toxin [Meiothermus sp. CFH 77666]MBO1436713.1 type II toxin-antitoxin system VapC family toxin [Meiothermus sp. CFH 77666]